jgi:glucose-6-phosphate 1-epimerase
LDTVSVFADLDRRFGIPGVAAVVAGNGGLAKVVATTPSAHGEMYLHGGHVTSWIRAGASEVLYVSPHSLWQDGRAIRGGVPVCFPWFGDKADNPAAPAHGFVRTKAWELESITTNGADVSVSRFTSSGEDTRAWWPYDFGLVCRATFGTQLKLELIVSNTGAASFVIEEALHAYFRVGDVETAALDGLDATEFIDKTDHRKCKTHHGKLLFTAETDSVFLDTQRPIHLIDTAQQRRVGLTKQNSLTTVVWNPWEEKSRGMSDLGDGEWRNFVCVEASNVGECGVHLAPGQEHAMSVAVQVASQ